MISFRCTRTTCCTCGHTAFFGNWLFDIQNGRCGDVQAAVHAGGVVIFIPIFLLLNDRQNKKHQVYDGRQVVIQSTEHMSLQTDKTIKPLRYFADRGQSWEILLPAGTEFLLMFKKREN
uniref:Uncharacterized protein n=1 Tax=Romanomermis culicivorax TaxID=13658 RepID=A0A915HV00_ROMCU